MERREGEDPVAPGTILLQGGKCNKSRELFRVYMLSSTLTCDPAGITTNHGENQENQIIFQPQPSDDPNDPLVRISLPKICAKLIFLRRRIGRKGGNTSTTLLYLFMH